MQLNWFDLDIFTENKAKILIKKLICCWVLHAIIQKAVFCSIKPVRWSVSGETSANVALLLYARWQVCLHFKRKRKICVHPLTPSKLVPLTGAFRAVSHRQWKRAHKQKFNFTQGHKLIGKCLLILIVIPSFLHHVLSTSSSSLSLSLDCGGSCCRGLCRFKYALFELNMRITETHSQTLSIDWGNTNKPHTPHKPKSPCTYTQCIDLNSVWQHEGAYNNWLIRFFGL